MILEFLIIHVNNEVLWIVAKNRYLLNDLFSILVFYFDKIYSYFLKFILVIILKLDNFEMDLDLFRFINCNDFLVFLEMICF